MEEAEFNEKLDELLNASYSYYQTGNQSPLTDEEYDLKLEYLKTYIDDNPEKANEKWKKLINLVASGTVSDNASVKFETPMLSLAKAQSIITLKNFLTKTKDAGAKADGWILESKLDGIAMSIRYKDGKLNQVITRSSGEIGIDVTQNLFELLDMNYINILGFARELKGDLSGKTIEFRGELFMTLEQFENTNKMRAADGENKYQNPRNATAGIINSKVDKLVKTQEKINSKKDNIQNSLFEVEETDSKRFANSSKYKSYATFLCYSYIADFEIDISKSSTWGLMDVLSITRKILNHPEPYFDEEKLLKDINLYGEKIIRDNKYGKFIPSPIGQVFTDGIVIKCVNDKKISEKLGFTEHHPNSQIAYKYMTAEDKATTKIQNIEISVGRTGRLSIRAKLSPAVNLYGSNIEYATLHSFDWVQKKDVRIGSAVAIIKANDVIPYIAAVLDNPKDSKPFTPPTFCPLCDTPLDKTTRFWRCDNNLCASRGVTALETAVGKSYLDIDSLSKKTLEAAFNQGLVRDIADIFLLTIEDLETLPTSSTYASNSDSYQKESLFDTSWDPKISAAFHEAGEAIPLGKAVATTIYNSIQEAKNIPFDRLLASLNIPLLGKKLGKSLVKKFGTMDNLLSASKEDLEEVELVSERKSEEIIKGLQSRKPLIEKLRKAGVNMGVAAEKATEKSSGVLESQNIVISGSIPGYSREAMADIIESHGGNLVSAVSNKTSFLVASPTSNSGKIVTAKKNNIKIVSPEEFLKKLQLNV
ncbi:MAG: hypothetical protein LBB10_02505 [Bifidobacteriaceae bacterium]|jgi:DNA ligase (NAD+)|nr:hypothetical protein [Bifidobacteriaceae bacterium]